MKAYLGETSILMLSRLALKTESVFQILLSGIPQVSILGPILVNILINDLFLFIKDVELANYADDNTIYAGRNSIAELIKVLEK